MQLLINYIDNVDLGMDFKVKTVDYQGDQVKLAIWVIRCNH